ncbi:MAG: hypothetical protein HRU38_01910 [Saccharospirillaceae bacterium]|nr:hypothetical protein [Pseudomonadales bacterium]NRB77414.1 hypothetical protein [Saccharospirillaceae bacterium]
MILNEKRVIDKIQISLTSIGVLGVIIFSFCMFLTFLSASTVEKSAMGFVEYQLNKEIREKYESSIEHEIVNKAQFLLDKYEIKEKQIFKDIENDLPSMIAEVIAQNCSCQEKKEIAGSIKDRYLNKISKLSKSQDQLRKIVQDNYTEIVQNLKMDLRIFSGSNLLMFLIVLLIAIIKTTGIKRLFLPAILLTISTIISICIYVFGQDWFYTIVYNDFMGISYLIYISVIFILLMDIVFNEARICSIILDAIGNAISTVGNFIPC